MTPTDDDEALDTLLGTAGESLPDDGFTAAVMRRVQAVETEHLAPTVDAVAALARLDRGCVRGRHEQRWRWIGASVGSAVALLAASATAPLALGWPQEAGLLVALLTVAWVLVATHALPQR